MIRITQDYDTGGYRIEEVNGRYIKLLAECNTKAETTNYIKNLNERK